MQVFRQYLDEKLQNPAFTETYFSNCAICQTTVRIVTEITESSATTEEIASACSITLEALRNIEAADKCCVGSMKKLCKYFNLPQPENCLQMKKLS